MKIVLLTAVGGLWLLATAQQVRIGGDALAVWRQATEVSPLKPRPWVNLGTQYARRDETDPRAQAAYAWALRLAETRPRAEREMTRQVVETNQQRLRPVDVQAWFQNPR